jgi:hypothetical protein
MERSNVQDETDKQSSVLPVLSERFPWSILNSGKSDEVPAETKDHLD